MESVYLKGQRRLQMKYFKERGIELGADFNGYWKPYCLKKSEDNIYSPELAADVERYFNEEDISFWHREAGKPNLIPNHILSSQVACLNHLFAIRSDPGLVLELAAILTGERFVEVLPVAIDTEANRAYIAFEIVSNPNLLNEEATSRGEYCTSIDAAIMARRANDNVVMIPIEWKYTEVYNDFEKCEKSTEKNPNKPKPNESRGETRLRAYSRLIAQSQLLRPELVGDNDGVAADKQISPYRRSIYFLEPFYELMRQTLLIEQFMREGESQWTGHIDDYHHVFISPRGNGDLLDRQYDYVSERGLEAAWRSCLSAEADKRFHVVDSSAVVDILERDSRYKMLADYLRDRYYR